MAASNTLTLPASNGALVAQSTTTAPTNGQIPIGNGTDYTAATITAGAGITVTNGAGSITVALPTPGTSLNYLVSNGTNWVSSVNIKSELSGTIITSLIELAVRILVWHFSLGQAGGKLLSKEIAVSLDLEGSDKFE